MKIKKSLLSVLIFCTPALALAQTFQDPGLVGLMGRLQEVLNSVIPVLVALGVVYFVWGVVQYVVGDSEEAKSRGRDHMIYGIIGLAVIVAVWGLVNILATTFGIESSKAPTAEELRTLLPQ